MKKTWVITGLLLLATGTMIPAGANASSLVISDTSVKKEAQWAPPPQKREPTREEIQASLFQWLALICAASTSEESYDDGYDRSYTQRQPSTVLQSGDYAQRVLDACNRERARVGAPPLRLSPVLQKAAAIRAEEITRRMSHTRPNGQPCQSVLPTDILPADVRAHGGENVAAGLATPEETVQDWMNSSGHRRNILDPNYRELGVGFYYLPGSEYIYYWVQIFTY